MWSFVDSLNTVLTVKGQKSSLEDQEDTWLPLLLRFIQPFSQQQVLKGKRKRSREREECLIIGFDTVSTILCDRFTHITVVGSVL